MRKAILKTMLRHTPITDLQQIISEVLPDYHLCKMPQTKGLKRGPQLRTLKKEFDATGAPDNEAGV